MKTALSVSLATVLLAAAPSSQAIDLLATDGSGPVGNCQPALPAYEGQIRKRPLAMVNESTTPAFVTCAITTNEVSLNIQSFSTRVTNQGATPATVTCTAVVGDETDAGGAQYVPRTIELAAGARGVLNWTGADTGGVLLNADSIALSCQLPPGVALNRNRITTLLSIL
jgi:hypothetical protein